VRLLFIYLLNERDSGGIMSKTARTPYRRKKKTKTKNERTCEQ